MPGTSPSLHPPRLTDPGLTEIQSLLAREGRVGPEEALYLYTCPDLAGVGQLADWVRRERCGEDVFYVVNGHINPTNICVYGCRFCAFARRPGAEGGYAMETEEVLTRADQIQARGATEVHLVGGLNPAWDLDHYVGLIAAIHQRHPGLHIKAYTAVEIAFFARRSRITVEETLARLQEAGLGSLPGGGAEILHPEVRQVICDVKHRAGDWITVHRAAHRMGLRSTATMLYGHIEEPRHKVDHLLQLRTLQDETGGFTAYVPLRFQPGGTDLETCLEPGPGPDLRELAVARIVLDSFQHIKAYWVMIGLDTAAQALEGGVDDIDGTILEERIAHRAGASTPESVTAGALRDLIRAAGRNPVERDSLYNPVHRNAAGEPAS